MKRPNELKDTVGLMLSEDYKDRFRAEYYQCDLRVARLHKMIVKLIAGTLDFTPDCPTDLLIQQEAAMMTYKHALEMRAEYEGIEL